LVFLGGLGASAPLSVEWHNRVDHFVNFLVHVVVGSGIEGLTCSFRLFLSEAVPSLNRRACGSLSTSFESLVLSSRIGHFVDLLVDVSVSSNILLLTEAPSGDSWLFGSGSRSSVGKRGNLGLSKHQDFGMDVLVGCNVRSLGLHVLDVLDVL